MLRFRRVLWLAPGLLVAAYCFRAYLQTLKPGLDFHDFAEMQVDAWLLGVPHGAYAFYVWLGWLCDRLPFGTPAYRLNLLSAICGGGAVLMVYLLSLRLSSRSWWAVVAASAAALAFGLGYTQWAISIFAQPYAPHVLLGLGVVWLALRWEDTGGERWLGAACFLCALMFSNHLMALSLVPPLGLFVLLARPGESRWRRVCIGAASFAVGLLFANLFLFWLLWRRHAPWDHLHAAILAHPDLFSPPGGKDTFWDGWWFNLGARQYRGDLSPGLRWVISQLLALPLRFLGELFPLGAIGAVYGARILFRRQRTAATLLLGIIATQSGLVVHHQTWKAPYYFVLPYACAAICLGVALDSGASWLEARLQRGVALPLVLQRLSLTLALLASLTLAALSDAVLAVGYRRVAEAVHAGPDELLGRSFGARPDDSRDHRASEEARRLLAPIPDGALVYATWQILYPLAYVALVDGERPHLGVIEAFPGPNGLKFSDAQKARVLEELKTRPVFLAGDPADAAGPYKLEPVAPGLYQFK